LVLVINTAEGQFYAAAPPPQNVLEDFIPGIPGTTASSDLVAAEVLTYLALPQAGLYNMVVNSDDGFEVTVGNLTQPQFLTLGSFDAGRSATDTLFQISVTQPGVYLFRLLYFQGSGGASIEWFTVNSDGSRALIGGTQPGSLAAFQRRTVPEPELPPMDVPMDVSFDGSTGEVVITWDATVQSLQESTTLQNWSNVTGSSPFRVAPDGPAKYYRLLVSP
jgi:hypothetical protein